MRLKKEHFFLVVLLLVIPLKIYSQDDLIFDHITVTQGLTQGLVNAIYRDSRDFMWFGTLQGINRYDGINIKKFESIADDSTTLTGGLVTAIYEDRDENLWVGTANGLNRFDYRKERFARFCNNPLKPNSLPDNFIVNISEDSRSRLWVVTNKGINQFNQASGDFIHYVVPDISGQEDPQIEASYTLNSDTIYFFTCNKIFQFLTVESTFKEIFSGIQTKEINTMLVDHLKNIWLGTENDGAYRITHTGKITHFYPEKNNNEGLQSISIKSINQDNKKNIWLSTRFGLYKLNNDNKTFTRYQNEFGNPKSLLSSYSRIFYEDKQGIIWVGTVGGVNKFDPGKLRFKHLKTTVEPGSQEAGSLYYNENIIWSFYLDPNNLLWIGSMRILLSYIPFDNVDKGNFTTASFKINGKTIIPPFNSVLEIKGDKKNNLWLGTDNGLYYFNTTTHEIKGYLHQPDNANSICDNIITSIVINGDSVLWIGTTNGMSQFNPSKNRFKNYYHNPNDSTSLINNQVNYLYTEDSRIWIAAVSGLSIIDLGKTGNLSRHTIEFRNIRTSLIDKGKSFNEVLTMFKISSGYYWLGTDNGICLMDSTLKIKEHYTVSDGLPNKIVNQIQEDSRGKLWISTENGISWFDPETKIFRNFNVNDGLQSEEFNANSSLKEKGYLLFGGINGFNKFNPDSIILSRFSPRVVITGMELLNKPVVIDKDVDGFKLTESIYETNEIKLDYDQNFFSFEFAALDYTNPEKIQYEYKLEGLDNDWITCNNSHSAHYTNVKPGKYTFKVKATNSDGILSENMGQIKVIIKPPFWKTRLFYLLSTLLLLIIVYLIYKYRIKAFEKDKELLEAEVKKRTHEIYVINQYLNKSNSFIESVISNATYGITVVNQNGDIIMANPAVSQLTGYSNAELLAMKFEDLSPAKWHDQEEEVLKTISQKKSIYHEKEYIRKDGSIIQVSISSSYINDYDIPAFVNIIKDISNRVANEAELQKHRSNLEELVKERTADLIVAKENAEKADRLKTAFLSNISHEIRTPMNSIIGFSHLLKNHLCEPEHVDEYLEYITGGAHNLLNIVTNIVEVSKISANDISIASNRINIIRLLNDICLVFKNKAKIKGLDFNLEYDNDLRELYIISDENKLSATINYLLDNALKFTHEGFIKLSLSASESSIEICIQDTGIGISANIQKDIFEPFKQADTTLSRAYGGTGLGLTISKAYIEKLGGRIRVDSVQGSGSKFYISLPLVKSEEQSGTEKKVAVRSKNLNILIVEDEDMNYRYLVEILKSKSKNIYHAIDGYSAIEQCKNNPDINIVLMDIKLPGINGLEATAEIKKTRPDLPVIAQTAYTLIGDREMALEAGCDDYISKPIEKEKLYSIINNYLKE